jgi:hypothetical protein
MFAIRILSFTGVVNCSTAAQSNQHTQTLMDVRYFIGHRLTIDASCLSKCFINFYLLISIPSLYISRGANVNAIGGMLKATPLHWAARQGHLHVCVTLLQHGADITLPDIEGMQICCC